jgi:DNA repair protein RadC
MEPIYQADSTEFVGLIVRDRSGREQVYRAADRRRSISSPEDAVLYAKVEIPELATDREHFVVVGLDANRRPLGHRVVSIGTLQSTLVHPREVFLALLDIGSVASFIAMHNHPSGSACPSREDRDLTDRLDNASTLMGIGMVDHVIVTSNGSFHSFRSTQDFKNLHRLNKIGGAS